MPEDQLDPLREVLKDEDGIRDDEGAVSLTYQSEYVKEFFLRGSKLYKEANFNGGTKRGMIIGC